MIRALIRSHRGGFIALTAIAALDLLLQAAGYVQVAGSTEAARQAFARVTEPLALQISYLLPLPHRLDTIGGFLTWRAYPLITVAYAVWAVLAAIGAIRGEEEHGVLAAWLAAGVGRVPYIAVRVAAFTVALAVSLAVGAVVGWAAAGAAGLPLGGDALAGESLTIGALALAWYGIALLVAQLVAGRGGATAVTVIVLAVLFFFNSMARAASSLDGLARISPFHLFDQSTVLVPGGRLDWWSVAVLLAVGLVGVTLAVAAFARRDLDRALFPIRGAARPSSRAAARNPLLRAPVPARLWQQRWSLLAWMVCAVLLGGLVDSVARSVGELVNGNPAMKAWLGRGGVDPSLAMIEFGWFSLATLALSILAVLRTAGWAAEDVGGRLEMTLAQPVPRARVVLERAVELGCSALLIGVAGSAAVLLLAPAQGIHPDGGRLAVATALLVPLALSFGAAGAALSAWLPRVAVGVLAALAIAAFFVRDMGPLFGWPESVRNLSPFQLYGSPFTEPVYWNGLWAMLAIVVVGFAVAAAALRRREVGR